MRRAALTLVVAATFAVTACTASPDSTPTAEPSSARPAPTSTASPASSPVSRFDVECPDLADQDAIATTFGITGPFTDFSPEPGGIAATFVARASFALIQDGALFCQWGDAAGADPFLQVIAIPVVVDRAELGFFVDSTEVPDASESCLQSRCTFVATSTDRTVQVSIAGPTDAEAEVFLEDARALTATLIGSIGAASIAPAWSPAEEPLAAPDSCAGLIADGTRVAGLGAVTENAEVSSVTDVVTRAALADVGGLACAWSGQEEGVVEIVMLPGGAWAWEDFPPRTTDDIDFTPRDGLGDDAATAMRLSDVLVDVEAGGSWLSVRADAGSVDEVVELARAVLAGVGWPR